MFNYDIGLGKVFDCSMYNTRTQNLILKTAIDACSITSSLLKGLEHPISAGNTFDHGKGNSHYHLAVFP